MPHPDEPQPGFYRVRLVKDGVWVAVKIWRPCVCTIGEEQEHPWAEACDRYPRLLADIGTVRRFPESLWSFCWPIDAARYRFMTADAAFESTYQPDMPLANPRRPVDYAEIPRL